MACVFACWGAAIRLSCNHALAGAHPSVCTFCKTVVRAHPRYTEGIKVPVLKWFGQLCARPCDHQLCDAARSSDLDFIYRGDVSWRMLDFLPVRRNWKLLSLHVVFLGTGLNSIDEDLGRKRWDEVAATFLRFVVRKFQSAVTATTYVIFRNLKEIVEKTSLTTSS